LDCPSKFFEASPLASIEAFLNDIEEIKITRCYIRGIRRMKHSCELFVAKNYVIVFELWSLALSMWRKNHFRRGIPMKGQSNTITEIFAFE
jgi:hypothetical protein